MQQSKMGDGERAASRVRRTVSGILMTLALAGLASAGALEDGFAAYQDKDYVKAVEIWRPLADAGNATAQFRLGVMYIEGRGVAPDDAEGAKWFRRAAEQGEPMAQFNLGASYAEGAGVPRDDAEAARWFRRAADQGVSLAQLNLGIMYSEGRGVAKDLVEAVKWIDLAVFSLPAGGARSDAARALAAITAQLTSEQIQEAKSRQRAWKAKPEAK
jgi:uncharacterized protein